jgi:DNA-binding transcriptional LysR family regulator
MREADVAIRMQPPRQPELIQRHLMTVHLGCYASPTYIKRHGIPKTPDELDQHRIIVYGEDTTKPPVPNVDWLLRAGSKKDHQRKPILRVNSTYAILRAVQSGLGMASLPEFMTLESSALVRVLPELQGPRIDAYFVYPEELRNSKRIQVFRDFLLRKVAESKMAP